MPAPALADAALFASTAIAIALATMWFARSLRRAMFVMIVVLVVGLAIVAAIERVSTLSASDPLAIAGREFALALIAIAVTRVVMMFVFEGLFARRHLPRILTDVIFVFALVGYAIYRMHVDGVNLAGIITTSALITAGIAFSLQETLGNLWGGIALQLDNTCRLGDWVRIDNVSGQIVGIRWRCIAVATNDGETVIIPNGQMIKNKVTVLGRRGDTRAPVRRHVSFRVPYGVAPSVVIQAVEEQLARAEIPNLSRRSPVCLPDGTDDHGLAFKVLYWVDDPLYDDVPMQGRMLAHALAALQRHSIEWPVPRRVMLHTNDLKQQRVAADAENAKRRCIALAQIPLFAAFTDAERAELATRLTDALYLDGDVVSQQGDPSDSLFVLARGRVKVLRDGQDRRSERRQLGGLEAPSYFGEMGLLTGDPRTATVVADGEALCYRLSRDAFDAVLKARPELVEELSHTIAKRRAENDATLRAMDDAARARHTSSAATELMRRIRSFFDLVER